MLLPSFKLYVRSRPIFDENVHNLMRIHVCYLIIGLRRLSRLIHLLPSFLLFLYWGTEDHRQLSFLCWCHLAQFIQGLDLVL
jgi:hypothetical protein